MTDTEPRKEITDARACGSDDLALFCAYLGQGHPDGLRCFRSTPEAKAFVDRHADQIPGKRRPTEEWPLCQNPIRRSPYWVSGGTKGGCVEAEDKSHALEIAREAGCEGDLVVKSLPYPADPRRGTPHWHERAGPTPSFCYRPTTCQGRTSCPRSPSCVD